MTNGEYKKTNLDNQQENYGGDYIPPGTFYANGDDELTKERILAIQLVEEIGEQIAAQHPEVAQIYNDNPKLRHQDIAQELFPELYAQYPEVYKKAVGWAIRQINSDIQQTTAVQAHRENYGFDASDPDFSEFCRQASKKRHEKHGVSQENIDAMIQARDRTRWSGVEKTLTLELIQNPDFQHASGSRKGTPNYTKIATELNNFFHDEEEIRTQNSVGSFVRDQRRKKT